MRVTVLAGVGGMKAKMDRWEQIYAGTLTVRCSLWGLLTLERKRKRYADASMSGFYILMET